MKTLSLSRLALALYFAFLAATAVMAEGDPARGLLDVAQVMQVAQTIRPQDYPNSDDVMLNDYIRVTYEPDGRAVSWDDTFVKVLTEKGKRENQTLSFGFTLPYSITSVTLLQVIKPDGRTVAVDVARQSRVMIDRSQMTANIYNPNDKVLQVGVPDLEIGDVVRYVARREIVKPRVPNTWSDYQILEYTSPIKRFCFEVHAPKSLPLRSIAIKDPVGKTIAHTKSEEGERIVYRWAASEVPRMFEEPDMPPLHTVVQRLLVSTIPDWRDISKWYWNLSEPHLQVSPAIQSKVGELTTGVKDRRGRIEAIFRWVSQEVRYMGITVEKDAPGYEPHDVTMTFEKRHGVCRDKAALLVAMLRAAGLEAWPVLIHNGPKKDVEVPQPFFNHAIACVEDEGAYLLMDPTDENTKDIFPAYLCDQSYLVAKPAGETLRVSDIIPATRNLMLVETRGAIDAGGNLKAESILRFEGINDNAYRDFFSRQKPEERRRYFEGVLKNMVAGAVLVNFDLRPRNLLDTTESISLRLEYEARNILVANASTVMLPLPHLGNRVGMVNFVLRRASLRERKYPLDTDFACGVRETLTLEVDPAIGAPQSLPKYPKIDDAALSWSRQIEWAKADNRKKSATAPRILRSEGEFLIKVVEFTPKQYLTLKDTLKTLEYNARKKPIFEREASPAAPQAAEADIIILEETDTFELEDAHNWKSTSAVRKQILTYKGKKDNAEIKIGYNPAWEDVRISSVTVVTNGETKTISPEEINVMDAGWVGAAPRYPAEKTLVASLPGVEVGSFVSYFIERRLHDRPFFALRASFRGSDPIRRKTLRVVVPQSAAFRVKVFDPEGDIAGADKPMRAMPGKRLLYEWTAGDQPRVKPEDSLPPWWSFNPTVFVTTGEWDAWAERVHDVLYKATRRQNAARDQARQIVRELKDDEAKIEAIRDFVARNIRPAGPDLADMPLTAVSLADRTLSEAYGNTSDRAVLLYAMLRAAGFRPDFVLASFAPLEPRLRENVLAVPAASLFDQVLVRVRADKRDIYLNDTNQYDALGYTSHDQRAGLDTSTGKLIDILAPDAMHDRSETVIHMQIRDDGSAHMRRSTRYFGGAYGDKKRYFAELPPEERNRYYQRIVSDVAQSAEPDGDLTTRFDKYPGIEEFAVNVDRYAVIDGAYLYFNLPASLRNLLNLRSDSRENPLYRPDRARSEILVRIELPREFRKVVLSPGTMKWSLPDGAGCIEVMEARPDQPDNVLEIRCRVELDPAVIPAGDYGRLLEIDRRLSHDAARTILLERTENK